MSHLKSEPHLHTKNQQDGTHLMDLSNSITNSLGKHQREPASRTNAAVADVEEVLGQRGEVLLDQGGVDLDEVAAFGEEMENAMAISEDEPSLKEALGGDKRTAWIDVIEAELTQMEGEGQRLCPCNSTSGCKHNSKSICIPPQM
jgi:hypothetical protein